MRLRSGSASDRENAGQALVMVGLMIMVLIGFAALGDGYRIYLDEPAVTSELR